MKTMVVYDSVYGNTAKVAQQIGAAIGGEVQVLRVGEVNASELRTVDLLVVGSPTQGGRPTQAIQNFLGLVPAHAAPGTRVAAFDTRLTSKWVRIFGYAAPRIAASLQKTGATPVGAPAGFFVKGKEGPLQEGEVERAAAWAQQIAAGR
jgi:flavodoxin I